MKMNDRYLFRGKRTDNGEWVVGYYAQESNHTCFNPKTNYFIFKDVFLDWNLGGLDQYEVILETVGQCTGLKDKNGKLIFEGDICEYGSSVGVIRYCNDDAMYAFVYDENDTITFDCMWGNDLEIIGNVTDNPELLEVKE